MAKKKTTKKNLIRIIKKILPNLILLVMTFIFCLILFEVTLRLIYPQSLTLLTFDDENQIRDFKPNSHTIRYDTSAFYRGVFVYDININSDGLRDKDYDIERNDRPRFIFAGDSMVFGEGVEIPFEKYLEEDILKDNVEILNFGYPGTPIDFYYNRVITKGLDYKPDAVFVSITIINDFLEPMNPDRVESRGIYSKPILFCFHNFHICPFLYGNYLKYGNYVHQKEVAEMEKTTEPKSCDIEQFEKDYQTTMDSFKVMVEEFKKLGEDNDFEVIWLVLPTREQVDDDMYEYFKGLIDPDKTCALGRYRINEDLKEIFNNADIKYLDPTMKLKRMNVNNSFYYDARDSHFNQEGHKAVAGMISDYLSEPQNLYLIG